MFTFSSPPFFLSLFSTAFRLKLLQLRVAEDNVDAAAALLLDPNPDDTTAPAPQLFDLVVSNPPYVLRKDLASVAPEISLYEDLRALDGGADGLDVILPILQLADKVGNCPSTPPLRVFWSRLPQDFCVHQ